VEANALHTADKLVVQEVFVDIANTRLLNEQGKAERITTALMKMSNGNIYITEEIKQNYKIIPKLCYNFKCKAKLSFCLTN
jgi:hypothetical protein